MGAGTKTLHTLLSGWSDVPAMIAVAVLFTSLHKLSPFTPLVLISVII